MRNKVITMVSKDYFQFGKKLLETRHIVDADFVCYGPDLGNSEIDILDKHNIDYKKVNQDIWDTWMQSLKFQFIMDEIDSSDGGITFVDWDTYFLKDWGGVFYRSNWSLGITVRNDWIEQDKLYRGWANGGVIFARNNHAANFLCSFALDTIEKGQSKYLLEYDKIWKTLETGRKPEKTHLRTNYRWWCDQIFLSALVMNTKDSGSFCITYSFGNAAEHVPYSIKLFDCKQYNNLWEETPGTYIMHLKEKSGASGKFKDGRKQ